MSNFGVVEIVLIILVALVVGIVFKVVPYWFIFRKAGFHPALSLLMALPLVETLMRFFLAFVEWPSLKKHD